MKTVNQAVTGIVLETRKSNADGLHPVKLRVTYNKDRKYYTLKGLDNKSLYMTPGDFANFLTVKGKTKKEKAQKKKADKKNIKPGIAGNEKVKTFFTDKEIKHLRIHIDEIEKKAMTVINEIKLFSFNAFEENYFSKPKDKDDLFSIMETTGKEMREAGRISTAVTFENGLTSLKAFAGSDKFPFERLTVKWLKDYEKWMIEPRIPKGKKKTRVNSLTTVGIYLRNVRTVFNRIKPVGVPYPFGKSNNGLYSIPKGKNTKKALTQSDVAKIANYKAVENTVEEKSRDYWIFSYLCNGINIKDVARLKYANIDGDKITLVRAKTANSTDEQTTIDIMITRQIGRIIDRHGNKPGTKDQYIFPILHNSMTPQDEYKAIQQAVQTINHNMVNVCKAIEIENVTTYTARHSFATVLKRSGASVEFISESLGHRNMQTTQNYLANFEDKEKMKWANVLLPETDN
ncbi:MAG: site-specific integrase [Bacteroidota bacterium]